MTDSRNTNFGSLMGRLLRIHADFRTHPDLHGANPLRKFSLVFPGSYALNAWDVIIAISRTHGLENFALPLRRQDDAIAFPLAITQETFSKMATWRWPDRPGYTVGSVSRSAEELFHSLKLSLFNNFDYLRGKADLLEHHGFSVREVYDFVFGGIIVTTVEGGPVRILAAMVPDESGKRRCFIIDAELGFQL